MAMIDKKTGMITGAMGDVVMRIRNGKQVIASKPLIVNVSKSDKSIAHRARFGACIALWRVVKNHVACLTYQQFMVRCLKAEPIYFSKLQLRQGACVITNAMLSTGPLEQIEWRKTEPGCWVSNITTASMGRKKELYPDLKLRFVVLKQYHNQEMVPCVKAFSTEIMASKLQEQLPILPYGLKLEFREHEDGSTAIAMLTPPGFQGGFCCMYLSRKKDNTLLASEQRIICQSTDMALFGSNEQRAKAIHAYR